MLTISELQTRPTVSVEEAGEVLGIHRTGAYAAVKRGDIPSFKMGRRVVIPTRPLLRMLGIEPDQLKGTDDE